MPLPELDLRPFGRPAWDILIIKIMEREVREIKTEENKSKRESQEEKYML